MDMLVVRGLTKRYEKFTLDNVSFSLGEGYIMGFIGRNGAGKTTTLKSMLGLVHPDAGEVEISGREFAKNELECKQDIGFVLGGFDYYPKRKLRAITAVQRRFYDEWNDEAYKEYLRRFELDEDKKVEELSEGMKVKYALALALSHNAQLLILDEPTSGLDPVSRDDLLEVFQHIIEDGQHSILFSTHITSDLDKCADFITYIKDGKIIESADRETLMSAYRMVRGTLEQLTGGVEQKLIGVKKNAFGFTGLAKSEKLSGLEGLEIAPADLESIMIYTEHEDGGDIK